MGTWKYIKPYNTMICDGCKWNARYFFIFYKFASVTHLSVRFIKSLFNTAFTAIIKYFMDQHTIFFYLDAKISFGMNRQEKLSAESLYWEHMESTKIWSWTYLFTNWWANIPQKKLYQRQMCETRIGSKLVSLVL